MEALVVDAEVVADFVEDGFSDLLTDFVVGGANRFDVLLLYADFVGRDHVVAGA